MSDGNENGGAPAGAPPARLKQRYNDEVRPRLQEEFGYTSPMQHPRLVKITLNMGVGEAKQNAKALDEAAEQLGIIEKEGSIHISNVLPIDPKTDKPTRVRAKVVNGKNTRVAKSGEALPS